MLDQCERRERIDHRHLNELPFAGALTMKQCGEHCVHNGETGHLVGHQGWGQRRGTALTLERIGDSCTRLNHVVVGRLVRVDPIGWPTMRLAHHDVGTHLAYRCIVKPQPSQRSRTQVRHHHIARCRNAQERIAPGHTFEVETNVAFVAQQVQRDARHSAARSGSHDAIGIAAGFFDSDDIGAKVAQDLRGIWPHHHRREVENTHTRQRANSDGVSHGNESC